MFIHKLLAAITVCGFSFSAFANKSDSLKELMPGYLGIQESLAADDLVTAKKKAQELQISANSNKEISKIKFSLAALIAAEKIEDARKEFKKLSAPFVEWVENSKDSSYKVVYCPMAGAKWVQKDGEVMNPYFGKEMLHCGEKAS